MSRANNEALSKPEPIRTGRQVTIEEQTGTLKRGEPVEQPSKNRPDYEQSREEPVDEKRLNKSGPVY